jgi:hypothetical protein
MSYSHHILVLGQSHQSQLHYRYHPVPSLRQYRRIHYRIGLFLPRKHWGSHFLKRFKQIERSIKIVNGLSNSEIVNQIEVFSDNVESTQSIKEGEKILLVHAVKQFKEILTEINNLNQLPQIC